MMTKLIISVILISGLTACQRTDNNQKTAHTKPSQTQPIKAKTTLVQSTSPQASAPLKVSNLTIGATSNLELVLPVLVSDFNMTHPDIKVSIKFDTSVNLYEAVTAKHQKFDIFLSSNQVFPRLLYEDSIRQNASASKYGKPFTYTRGQLVLYSAKYALDTTPTSTLDNFYLDKPTAILAITNPQVSLYGSSVEEWLVNQNLMNKLQNNIIYRPSIEEVFDDVVNGQADFGFVGLSQILATQNDTNTSKLIKTTSNKYAILPKNSYPPVLQDGIVLQQPEVSQQFVDYLLTTKAQDVLTEAGYLPICTESKLLPACK